MRNTIRSPGKPKGSSRSQKLAGEVQLARIRLARAESELKSSEEHLRVARRRRKEAKQAARRAKRNFKLAQDECFRCHAIPGRSPQQTFESRRARGGNAEARPKGSSQETR